MNQAGRNILFLSYFILFSTTGFSQNAVLDSLENELSIHLEKDTVRVNLLNKIAHQHAKNDYDTALKYIEESEAIAREIDFKKGIARSLYIKGIALSLQSKFDLGFSQLNEALQIYEAINFKKGVSQSYDALSKFYFSKREYKKAIPYDLELAKIREKEGDNKGVSDAFFYAGRAYAEIGNYTDAILYYNKSLDICKEVNYEARVAYCLGGLGDVYSHQGNYQVALDFYNESIAISKKYSFRKSICYALISMGNIYIRLENYDKAITFHTEALEIAKVDDKTNLASIYNNLGESYKSKKNYELAHVFFIHAIEKFKEKNNKPDEAVSLNNIGDIYLESKNYSLAIQHFEKAMRINLEVDNPRGLCDNYLGLAKINAIQKKYNKALKNALKSKEIANKLKLLQSQKRAFELLSSIYKNKGYYKKAFESHQQFKTLNDSLFNKRNIEKITQLEYEYKYKQRLDSASNRELKLTRTVISTNQDLAKSQRYSFIAIIIILIISIISGGTIFFLKLKHINAQNQNILIEQKLLRSQMTPHFIFNSLSVLQGMILNKEEKKSISYLSKFSKLLRTILENSRHKTVSLSDELSAIDSYMALQNLDVNPSFKYQLKIDKGIDESALKIPPMLIQPFIENAIEHAFVGKKENKEINVKLTIKEKKLICTIADNGIGITTVNQNLRKDKKSLATTITSERLKMLAKDLKTQGSVTVQNRQLFGEQGTLATLVIPFVMVKKTFIS